MNGERIRRAALNNAVWCDTVCRSHGRPGAFTNDLWTNRHPTPRFYPNGVALAGKEAAGRQTDLIREMAACLPGGWAVKDSFSALDLGPFGFRPLFEAEWISRPLSLAKPGSRMDGVKWGRLNAPPDLAEWERAWAGLPNADTECEGELPRVFLPDLLEDENVAVLVAHKYGRTLAGVIANRTAGEVGLSNFFAPGKNEGECLAGCVALAMEIYPGVPLVGYERGPDLEPFQALGFEKLGPLRVWVRDADIG